MAGEFVTRSFLAGTVTFEVRCPSAAEKETVEQLFCDLPAGDAGSAERIYLVEEGAAAYGLRSAVRDVSTQDLNGTLASLVTIVSRLSLDGDPAHLHLHCAVLSYEGRGVLISAASGTGKTTLTAALLQRGWTYISDEAGAVAAGETVVSGFPKPLLIKPGGAHLVQALVAAGVATSDDDFSWLLVPVGRIPANVAPATSPSMIVILHRSLDGSVSEAPVIREVHPADAVVSLMGQTMDPQRFGRDAVVVLAHLAAQSRCLTVTVGPLEPIAAQLEELAHLSAPSHPVRVLDGDTREAGGRWHIEPSTRAVLVGERAVLHDTDGGTILALDEAGTALWLALRGEPPAWWASETLETPAVEGFLRQLASFGLLSSRTLSAGRE